MSDKRRISIEDLYQMKWISDPQISPDGSTIAYVVKTVNAEDKMKYKNHIWVVPSEGGEPMQFTNGGSETNPRWSPDGSKLAFTSKRGDNTQVWVMPTTGGEALAVTNNAFNASNPAWSPDGKKIAFVGKVSEESDEEGKDKEKSDVKVITSLHYKQNGVGFLNGKNKQIFVVDVVSKEQKQLTTGVYDCDAPTWSPCSGYLAFASNRTEDADYNHQTAIWVVPADGGELRKVTEGEAPCTDPSWAPDGKHIAYYSHDMKYKSATLPCIYVIPAAGGDAVNVIPNFDRTPRHGVGGDSVSSPSPGVVWSKDSDKIYFLASDHGKTAIYESPVNAASEPKAITCGDHAVYGMSYNSAAEKFALAITSFTNIGDLYCMNNDGEPKRLTEVNKELLSEVSLSQPERFEYEFEGMDVEGWIMKPFGFKEGVKYPAVLEIHGGPHAAYGHIFFHEFQLLAAAGYVVVFTNPPGSRTYGQEFLTKTRFDWGGMDYRALMKAVEVADALDYIDSDRWGVTGGSYGGYMVNWMIGQTDKFKAGVSMRSTCNRYSQFGTSDVGFFNGEFEQKGNPWDSPEFYLKVSPISYVNNVTTPLMLIHSEDDMRCPVTQAEEFFTALKWLRKEVVMVRFPGETHELSRSGKPRHRTERLQHMLNWFEKYVEVIKEDYSC